MMTKDKGAEMAQRCGAGGPKGQTKGRLCLPAGPSRLASPEA